MKLAAWLQAIWYGDRRVPFTLRALVPVYRLLRAAHRAPYRLGLRKRSRVRVPVVVVGNMTAGGTGKTPLVIALVEALRARGFKPGVISRGYGASAAAPLRVSADSDPGAVGDEPCLIQRITQAPVAVGRDRVAAANLLLAENSIDVLLADDGLQHHPLHGDVQICVIDGERRFGNRRLLPAGPLREPLARLSELDFRVCNGGAPQAGEVAMILRGEVAVALLDSTQIKPLREFSGQRVHAVAGIGNPSRFFTQLRAAGLDVIEHSFPDHHAFGAADIDFGDKLPVLMTDKDAVKCASFADARHSSVPVRAQLPPIFFDNVVARVRAAQQPMAPPH